MNKLLKVKCPNCDVSFEYYQSEYRPFCSERCKMVDLGHWFKESYRVPVKDNQIYDNEENDEKKESESHQESSIEVEEEDDQENY